MILHHVRKFLLSCYMLGVAKNAKSIESSCKCDLVYHKETMEMYDVFTVLVDSDGTPLLYDDFE